MIQTLRISFIALVLATLSACGGGGGGGTPTAKTTPTPITVIDGYIQGAIVCVDKNKNGSCDTGETQGKTGADGKVVLDIPLDDVGKYPIVAYVPADAIDKDDGKAVGTAFTLIAPAGSSTLVTPLTTLVQHLMVNGGKSSADASAQIKQAIGDPSVDYIANAQATQTRAAAKILAKLMQNLPASVSGQTDAQKTTALYTILMNALPEVQAQAQTLVTASACSESITSTDCQSSVSVAATAMKDSGKLSTAFQDWNANRRPITKDLQNPNVLDTVTFSVNNLYSDITSVEWDVGDGVGRQTKQVEGGVSSITARYSAKGEKTVIVSYKNASGAVLATDSLTVSVGEGSVSQAASITDVKGGGTTISNGARTDSLVLTLSGTYSGNVVGSNYSIRVMDGDTILGTETLAADAATKTWSFTTGTLAAGSHDFKAVVVRNIDSKLGTASSAYTVQLGNSVGLNSGANVLDTITLSLSKLWNNVKSVVFSFTGDADDLVDAQTASQTVNASESGLWPSITTAFRTMGNKVISLVFKDGTNGTGNTLETRSITASVGQGSVSQKASILSIKDHATPTANEIVAGQVTKDSTPVISGTVDVSLSQFYDVAVFDNGTKLAGQLVYTNNRKDWSFTPASALSQGEHTITSGVVRIDGVEGPKDSERKFVLLLSNLGFSPVTPQLGLPVSFSASNVWSNITTVLWNFGDGITLRDFTYEGRSNVQHTFAESSGVGNKTVTVSYVDTTGKTVGTEQLVLNLGPRPVVTQLATITTIKDGNTILQNGDTASSLSLTLQGSYQGTLEPGYSVEVIVDGMDWDSAYIDPINKTWTSTKAMPWFGSLKIQVVVKRYEQIGPWRGIGGNEYFGSYSDVFNVKIGNKLTPSSTQLSTWDEWVLNLSNVWRNVRTAVITFVADASDLVDGLVTRTLSGFDPMYMQQRGQSLSISAGFKTTGDKAVNIAYLDGNGQMVSTDSVRLTLNAAGAVTQIPTVDAITSIANQPIENNASTLDTVSSVNGSLSAAIGKFYYVEVYDNGSNTAIPGTMRYNENRTTWTFTPSTPLAIGSHALTAAVVRGDGVSGARSVSAWNFTLTQPRYIKIGANGTALANQNAKWSDTGNEADGTRWDCIQESDTGRMWEVKPKTPNQLRNSDSTFTYYIPNPRVAGSWVGSETSNGICNSLPSGKNCNTQNYVDAVNSVGVCGKKDWRLPTQTDVDQQVKGFPKLYFPNLNWFWVESESSTEAWYVEAYSTVFAEVGPVTYYTDGPSDATSVILVRNSR